MIGPLSATWGVMLSNGAYFLDYKSREEAEKSARTLCEAAAANGAAVFHFVSRIRFVITHETEEVAT